jgi:predicted O-linked N-acetylglucosamine transferase (SPINDLY family)
MPSANYRQALAEAEQLFKRRDWSRAEQLYREVLSSRPRETDALQYLGYICGYTQRHGEAADFFRRIVEINPYATDALGNCGVALTAAGRHEEAVDVFQRLLILKPGDDQTFYNLGVAYSSGAHFEEAVAAYRRAVELNPTFAGAYFNMGKALRALRRLDEAIAAFRETLRLEPQHAEACDVLGHCLREQFQFEEAIEHFRRALAMRPGFTDSLSALANTLQTMGQVEEAANLYRHHVQRNPGDHGAHAEFAFALAQLPEGAPEIAAEEHKRWGRIHTTKAAIAANSASWETHDRSLQRTLRVGYVSSDFREHAVAFFLENLIAFHRPNQVQTYCYASVGHPDAFTERFQKHAHVWREVSTLSDARLAALIREDAIDILVDLAGHTSGNRLMTFAERPAPVQVAYLGYVDTVGMTQMDYRLVDAITDPPGLTDALYTERLVRLPRTFACYLPPEQAPPLGPLPALANGYITFGCFSGARRVHPTLLLSWASIMQRVPNSRIVFAGLGFSSPTVQTRTRQILATAGIAADRLEFVGFQKIDDYLHLHHRIDVVLDPFPINGHTTTCHALWMGVPVVSRAGVKYVSRLGASVLTNLGLPELLAGSAEEYVEIAVNLANDWPRLSALRAGMRERMKASPLMDYPAFAADVEAAYREMWIRWCA